MAKTYDTYKDSGIAWIGEIPGEWEVCRLKDTSSLYTGNSIKDEKKDYYEDKNDARPYIATKDIDATYMTANYENGLYIKHADNNFRIAPPFSSLMCIEGGSAGRKKTFIDREVSFVNKLCCFAPLKGVLGKYIYYFLCSPNFEDIFNSKITGLIGGVNIPTLKNIECLLPPLSVQQSISSFLDTKCGEIDSLISIQEEMISELLAYKQSVITEAVTKGHNKKAKMKNSGVEWIGDIPEEWVKDKIFRVFSVIGSGTTPKATDDRNFEGDINWIQSGDINGGKMFECKNKISENVLNQYSTLKIYKAPFIIVAMYGASVGNISISNIDGCVNQACCVMSNSNQCFNYLFYAIKAAKDYLIYRAEGGGQPNISQDKLKNLWLPLPPLPVQQAIATYLDEKTTQIDSLIALKQSKIESLKEYKKSIIYEYVTGKKRV